MATSRCQRLMLLTACCLVAALPSAGHSLGRQDGQVPPEIGGEPCGFTDPADSQRILGPNPAHADCLSLQYPAQANEPSQATTRGHPALSLAATLPLYLAGFGMLMLARSNSRKRRGQSPGRWTR